MKNPRRYDSAFDEGEDYASFTSAELHGEDFEYLEKMAHYHATCVLDDETKKRIEGLEDEVKLLAVAERWCPDSMINLPALKILEANNPKISLRIVNREGHEDLFEDGFVQERALMPTVLVFKNERLVGTFIERPKVVMRAEHAGEQVHKIAVMKAYRDGQYMVETICDILAMLAL